MTTIATSTDMSDHVADTCANHSEFERQIVEILAFRSDRPACGEDRSNWPTLTELLFSGVDVNAGTP